MSETTPRLSPAWYVEENKRLAAEITSLRAQLDEARRRAIQLPKWNDLTAAQRNAIADGILLPHPEERMQTAIEVYAAVRRALLSESKT